MGWDFLLPTQLGKSLRGNISISSKIISSSLEMSSGGAARYALGIDIGTTSVKVCAVNIQTKRQEYYSTKEPKVRG